MKILFGVIVVGALLFGGYVWKNVVGGEETGVAVPSDGNNTSIVENQQIIELRAKGGYTPKVSRAQAGIPTILRVTTSGTFDCSSALRIPSLQVSKNLPATGVTDIVLGTLTSGTIQGNCSMGMYPFSIEVQE